jgi:hypothetical protein
MSLSQALREATIVPNTGTETGTYFCMTLASPISPTTPIGDNQHISHSEKAPTPQGESSYVDGSGPIFSIYLERAKEEDETAAESWQADANGILVFVRLSSYPLLHTDS